MIIVEDFVDFVFVLSYNVFIVDDFVNFVFSEVESEQVRRNVPESIGPRTIYVVPS